MPLRDFLVVTALHVCVHGPECYAFRYWRVLPLWKKVNSFIESFLDQRDEGMMCMPDLSVRISLSSLLLYSLFRGTVTSPSHPSSLLLPPASV